MSYSLISSTRMQKTNVFGGFFWGQISSVKIKKYPIEFNKNRDLAIIS